jgi:SAM-dependent methyltransferase
MHRIIDWNELWEAIHVSSPGRTAKDSEPGTIWDKKASSYHRGTRDERSATQRDLEYLDLRAGDTVLDMGAGTGRLAVPIAGRVSHVTALDPSGGMLGILQERMSAEGRTNYSCLQMRWEDVVIGRDIEPHDTVIAAFSLGFYDLWSALEKLNAAARRSVYLFWHAGEWRGPEEMALYRAVFGDRGVMKKGYPDYQYPLNILHDEGIYANVRIYQAIWEAVYESAEEAARHWVVMHHPELGDISPVTKFFSRVLQKDSSGRLVHTAVRRTAVIWWTKE